MAPLCLFSPRGERRGLHIGFRFGSAIAFDARTTRQSVFSFMLRILLGAQERGERDAGETRGSLSILSIKIDPDLVDGYFR